MSKLICGAFGLSLCASLLVLYLGAHPGILSDIAHYAILFCLAFWPLSALLLIVAVIALVILLRRWPTSGRLQEWHWFVLSAIPLVLVASLGAVSTGLSFRMAFGLARPRLEAAVSAAPVSGHQGDRLGRFFGPYFVDRYGADPRGGVYFRVMTLSDLFDTMSGGFAFRPNRDGTPFGAAKYEVFPLGGDWYWFWASDDSY